MVQLSEILSIDIADIDVGENIGARLQADQAEADKRVAQAQAEMRRAAAVALEQEMIAKVQEMQAKVVEARSSSTSCDVRSNARWEPWHPLITTVWKTSKPTQPCAKQSPRMKTRGIKYGRIKLGS